MGGASPRIVTGELTLSDTHARSTTRGIRCYRLYVRQTKTNLTLIHFTVVTTKLILDMYNDRYYIMFMCAIKPNHLAMFVKC